jgi:ribonuclease HII
LCCQVVTLGAEASYRVGVDENGLGARIGPLIVTAVLAHVSPEGERWVSRRPRGKLSKDLDDSKRLVSHANYSLGEAWARVLTGDRWQSPQALFEHLSLEASSSLRRDCPKHVEQQCWGVKREAFGASGEQLSRLSGHLTKLRERGIDVRRVLVTSVCNRRLNQARLQGKNRFVSDLHAMEGLLLGLREQSAGDLHATCGKVGGMADYDRFFGPLAGRLHTTLEVSRERSAYYFPGLGHVHFVQDADARDVLVMLASLVGKYVRELLMGRIAHFYEEEEAEAVGVSGYHDDRTDAWVQATLAQRRQLRIVDDCFERARDVVS